MPIYQKSGTGQILLTSGGKVAVGSGCCCGATTDPNCSYCPDGELPASLDVSLSGVGGGGGTVDCTVAKCLALNGLYTLTKGDNCCWNYSGSATQGQCDGFSVLTVCITKGSEDIPHYYLSVAFTIPDFFLVSTHVFQLDLGETLDCTAIGGTVPYLSSTDGSHCDFSGATVTVS